MASVGQDPQGIFFPILLIPGHPLFGTSENHSSSLLTSQRHLTRVWHKALLAKLPAYGFTLSFCKLISNFLSNRFISVVDGTTSASFLVSSGVPLSSVLLPTFFLLFINDLLHAFASFVHSFANVSTLHKSSFQCQPSSNVLSQSRLAMSSTINSDLQSISERGTLTYVSTPLLVPNVSMNGVHDILDPVTLRALFMRGNVVDLIVSLRSHRWKDTSG